MKEFTYDVFFDDDNSSNNKGFRETKEEAIKERELFPVLCTVKEIYGATKSYNRRGWPNVCITLDELCRKADGKPL